MTTAYRDRLERELARIRSVADDFEAALRVEALLNGSAAAIEPTAQKVLELKVDAPKKTSAKITIRKVVTEDTPAAAPTKKPRKGNADHSMWRERVLKRLRENGPASSTALMKHFKLSNASKAEKQVLYQVMYDLKRLGMATRDEDMVYHPVDK